MNLRPTTLLWAPRSPCNLACSYCYFGTLDDLQPVAPGSLSHIGTDDVPLDVILAALANCSPAVIGRVFIAGGEPLLWHGCHDMIAALKARGIEVIVCTNGLPLRVQEVTSRLLAAGVDAISISLDSHDAAYNDRWRTDRSGTGWMGVVDGMRKLLNERRRCHAACKIGVYMVVTAANAGHIVQTASFVDELGVDYFIFQPVSLRRDHKHYGTLALNHRHLETLAGELNVLYESGLRIILPHESYVELMLEAVSAECPGVVRGCFGGRDLFFIQPDGSVWDCPSWLKIAATPPERRASIRNTMAAELLSPGRRSGCTDCALFSVDCVNMWPLMAFDAILRGYERGNS